jgi:hypothetical protein
MCTVTFVPRRTGYALAMNRDEKLSRPAGLEPRLREADGRKVLGPSEPGGGTWIAVNETGAAFALINWYGAPACVTGPARSRGQLVRAVAPLPSPASTTAQLKNLPLNRVNPFRLVGVFPDRREIVEWRWNRVELVRRRHPWKAQQWISSGFDEARAQGVRGRTFRRARRQRSAGRLEWLRRLHRSHAPRAGPFSTCMHRAGAETVSYTEISVSARVATLRYHGGPPCRAAAGCGHRLPLRAGIPRAPVTPHAGHNGQIQNRPRTGGEDDRAPFCCHDWSTIGRTKFHCPVHII